MAKAKDEHEGKAKHITVDAKTGEVVEVWLPKEKPEPETPRPPTLQEQIDELRTRIAVLEHRHG